MEHREDAVLCQHLLRERLVPVHALVGCAEAQRLARRAGERVPYLWELLLARGLLAGPALEEARRAADTTTRLRGPSRRAPAADELRPGDRLGPYLVCERLGRGSMGSVYDARCRDSGERVAVKVLSSRLARTERALLRFDQESTLACTLRHEGLVRGLRCGKEGGRLFLAMEYLPWPALEARLADEGRLSPADTAALGAQVARALAYLHEEGVVHRDVKPANVLVGGGLRAKLCDLGLARELDRPSEATEPGGAVGTPRYMAPEQARGEEVGPAADVYALGITLFHAVAGRPPFPEESGLIALSRHLFDQVPDVRTVRPEVGAPLARLIHQLTRKNPGDRPTAAAAAVALETCRVARVEVAPAGEVVRLAA